eukprot:PhM_4_TR2536/c0_g1_i1/m.61221
MPERLPYLHPSQRNLRTDQIGPSSHKNEFRPGVLIGEWQEQKSAVGLRAVYPKLQTRTIYRNSFYGDKADKALYSRPKDYPRELLFGQDVRAATTGGTMSSSSSYSSSHLASTIPPQQPSVPPSRMLERKRQEWDSMRDPDVHQVLAKTTTTRTMSHGGAAHRTEVRRAEYSNPSGEFRTEVKWLRDEALGLRN